MNPLPDKIEALSLKKNFFLSNWGKQHVYREGGEGGGGGQPRTV